MFLTALQELLVHYKTDPSLRARPLVVNMDGWVRGYVCPSFLPYQGRMNAWQQTAPSSFLRILTNPYPPKINPLNKQL